MPEASIPPWMQTNPLAGIPLYLQGYGQGAQVGESQRRAEARNYEAELQQAAAQERNEILREAKRIQAAEFAENLKLKQEQAQQAAREAAVQLEGQQGLEKDLQSGIPFQEAFPRWATKILYKHPQSLTQVLNQLTPRQSQYGEPTTVSLGGQQFGHIPGSATLEPIQQTAIPTTGIEAVPIKNPDTGEITYGRPGAGGTVIPLPRGENKAATLRLLRKEKRDLAKAKEETAEEATVRSIEADILAVQAEIDRLSAPKAPSKLPKPATPEEYEKVPSDSDYVAPDGTVRHKK